MSRSPKATYPYGRVPLWALNDSVRPNSGAKAPKQISDKDALLRVDEAAACLNLSTKTIRRLVKARALRAARIGQLLRISPDEVELFLAAASHSTDAPTNNPADPPKEIGHEC